DLTHGTTGERPPLDLPSSSAAAETFLVQFSRWAMACEFQIYLTAQHPPHAPEAAMAALDLIERLEDQMTVFRPDSEISRINRQAAMSPVEVEPQLLKLLGEGVALFHETEHAFDVTAGPLSKVWGFHRRQGRLPPADELAAALACVGSDKLHLDPQAGTIAFALGGMEINLGAIGKGYALDRAAERLTGRDVGNFLIHGGRSSVLARGARIPWAAEDNPWLIGIGNPLRPQMDLGNIALCDQALSTSGGRTQSFHHEGQRYGHILDPRTGQPATGVVSVTVVCDSAATADALSTALYVLGPERTEAFCRRRTDVAVLLATEGHGAGQLQTHAWNFRPGVWRPHRQGT
ncbi:MAG: FAD:protein FMN transferase, partial [Planctomycetales bacterium]|nr:FAD:protein FMN transferase [Planctomycetales bacterium]